MRLAFYKNIMRQEMGWFDSNNSGEMNVKLTEWVTRFVCVSIGDDRQADTVSYSVCMCEYGRWPSSWQSELLGLCVWVWEMTVKLTEWVTRFVCVSMGDDRQADRVSYSVCVCEYGRWPSSWQSELLCDCVCD